jgi:hypothetical protein
MANHRLEIDAPQSRATQPNVRPTADGRANGSAGEPRWLRPPAAVEPADGTDGPAGHGSPADPLGCLLHHENERRYTPIPHLS